MLNGHLKFSHFMRDNCITLTSAAKEMRCSVETVRRYTKGLRKPIDSQKVIIEKFTRGHVKILDWFNSVK